MTELQQAEALACSFKPEIAPVHDVPGSNLSDGKAV